MTPEDDAENPLIADRWSRLFARLVDIALLWLVPLVPLVAVAMVAPEASSVMGWLTMLVLAYIPVLLCCQAYLLATRGQSVGKVALGIRIVDADGNHPGWATALLAREGVRLLLGAVPLVGGLLWLIDSAMVFRSDHRTWHDQLVGTYVVRRPRAPDPTAGPRLHELRSTSAPVSAGVAVGVVVALASLMVCGIGMNAAIAIPNFLVMQNKAKRSEVPGNVDEIRRAQESWRAVHGAWLPIGSDAEARAQLSGKAQRPWDGGDEWTRLGWAPDSPIRGAYWVEVRGDDLLVLGISDVDGDGNLAVYEATASDAARLVTDPNVY